MYKNITTKITGTDLNPVSLYQITGIHSIVKLGSTKGIVKDFSKMLKHFYANNNVSVAVVKKCQKYLNRRLNVLATSDIGYREAMWLLPHASKI